MWGRKEQPYLDNKDWERVGTALQIQAARGDFIGKLVNIHGQVGFVEDIEINPQFSFGESQKPIRVSMSTPNGVRHLSYIKSMDEIEPYPAVLERTTNQEEYKTNYMGQWGRPKLKVKLDPGAKMPTRAHPNDVGLDLYATKNVWIRPHSSAFFDTGVHIAIPAGFAGLVKSRSGLMVKFDATTDGTIDPDYTGSIGVTLFNHGGADLYIKAGDRIAQLVIVPVLIPELDLVDELEETDRGAGGFGSTGR